jgi:hypothetical protein
MDTQPLDHSFHSADVPNLHTDLHTHQDFLSDPTVGVHHDPFAPSSIGTYEANYVHSGFDSHNLADYQPYHANSLLDHQYSHVNHPSHLDHSFENQYLADYQPHHANSLLDHQYSQVGHPSHLDHHHSSQRSGSEQASELLSKANELEKKANESKSSSEYNTKNADWHRDHNNPSNAASYDENARSDMAKSEQYRAEAQNLREQAKKV